MPLTGDEYVPGGMYPVQEYWWILVLRVPLAWSNTPMHLATDYIHAYKDAAGRPARCRVRIYLSDDARDSPVAICSELTNNPGGSVTASAEGIVAGVLRVNRLRTPLVWIEHWPKKSTGGGAETFEMVVFSSYEVIERAPYLGETRAWVGGPTWKPLDRASGEMWVRWNAPEP